MEVLTMPGVSPAKLFIAYTTNLNPHTLSVNLQESVDIQDTLTLSLNAVQLATALAGCCTPSVRFNGWGLRALTGGQLYAASFAAPIVGGLTPPINSSPFNSNTVRVEGKAAGIAVGAPAGRTSFELFVSDSLIMVPGDQYLDMSADVHWAAVKAILDGSTRLFCDLFGQKADVANLAPVQFNAHEQRVHGS
jgi:hypothetical protein